MLTSTLPALGVVFLGADGKNRVKQVLGEVSLCCVIFYPRVCPKCMDSSAVITW